MQEPVTDLPGPRAARFEREVLPHLDRVYCAARCLANGQSQARRMVQETFVSAYAAFGQMAPDVDIAAWLYRILIGTIASRRDRQLPGTDPPAFSEVSAAEISAVARLPGAAVKDALRQLPLDARIVVYLADVEGFARRDIAGITGASIDTVAWRLYRGRRQLRDLLCDYAAGRPTQNGAGR